MALDFPNPPLTVGQQFVSGTTVWQWDGSKWIALSSVPARKVLNYLHNPLFTVRQRGAGPFSYTGGNQGYTADQWINAGGGSDADTINIVALTDADRAAIGDEEAEWAHQIAFTGSATSGSYSLMVTRIEDLKRLSGKTVTLSFWARATSGTPKLGLELGQLFGSGGSPTAPIYTNIGTPTLSTTWTRYAFTGALGSAAGKTFGTTAGTDYTQIGFWYSDQGTFAARSGGIGVQSGTVQLWGMQLEVGGQATALEKRDPQTELALCQRFYNTGTVQAAGTANGGTGIYSTWYFPPMRATPTLSYQVGGSSNGTVAFFQVQSPSQAYLNMAVTATGSAYIQIAAQVSAEL